MELEIPNLETREKRSLRKFQVVQMLETPIKKACNVGLLHLDIRPNSGGLARRKHKDGNDAHPHCSWNTGRDFLEWVLRENEGNPNRSESSRINFWSVPHFLDTHISGTQCWKTQARKHILEYNKQMDHTFPCWYPIRVNHLKPVEY